ncbi:MAG: amidase [Rhodospirillaceae bacterium]|nr:amidase [Rhodospirillaceae bacterium]
MNSKFVMDIEYSTIQELGFGLGSGAVSSVELVEHFLKKIAGEDECFNAIAFRNPNAADIASQLDHERRKGYVRGPLHGIPLLIKDNIDTADGMMTSAGSLALDGSMAVKDAHLVSLLRQAGAVILGKTNLSEWANFRSTRSSSGWSSRGGQVRNAYATDRTPGGSSSGSGVAVARGFCAGAIGTETDGSIVGPSAMNSIVGIKPTVGLVSRSGIIPISHSQDTAGPMARTVADAAIILAAIAGPDRNDIATAAQGSERNGGNLSLMSKNALKGQRIGVVRNFAGFHEGVDAQFENALALIRAEGAEIVDDISLADPTTIRKHEIIVMRTEFKVGLNRYLSKLPSSAKIHSLAELIAFNEKHRDKVMPYFEQEQLLAAEMTCGLDDCKYKTALVVSQKLTRDEGIDKVLTSYKCSALVAPTSSAPWAIDLINGDNRIGGSSCLAAVSGYPSVTVPMGYVAGLPVGISFTAKAWQDKHVIDLAYAFERAGEFRSNPGPPARFLS